MNYFYCLVACILLPLVTFAEEKASKKLPMIYVEAKASRYVSGTESYVLFLLEGTGTTMTEAKKNFDQRLKNFSKKAQKEFSKIKLEVISVNIGTRDFSSYRAAENPVAPTCSKVLIYTIPPDETQAVKLLDAGIKSGLSPFCAATRNGKFGAVFYGIKDSEKKLVPLYPVVTKKLQNEAQKIANILNRKIIRMNDLSDYSSRKDPFTVRFKDIEINLPTKFCSSDKDKIKISLHLRASFEVEDKKLKK